MNDDRYTDHNEDQYAGDQDFEKESDNAQESGWDDDQPPIDDFDDHAEDEQDVDVAESAQQADPVKRKSSSWMIPAVVLLAGLGAAGYFIYMQFGQQEEQVASTMIAPPAPTETTPQQQAQAEQTIAAVEEQIRSSNAVALPSESLAQPAVPSPMPAPIAEAQPMTQTTEAPAQTAETLPAETAVIPTPVIPETSMANAAPQPIEPTPQIVTETVPTPTQSPTAGLPVMPVAPATATNETSPPDAATLSTQDVGVLQRDIAELKAAVQGINDRLAQMQPSAMPPADVAALQQRLAQAETQIRAMENKLVAGSATSEMLPDSGVTVEPPMTKTVAAPAPQKPAPKPVAKAAAKKPAVAKTTKPSQWVLRGAMPDRAWVADANAALTADLKEVRIGDNLAGIGTVKDIRQEGGKWMIVGSKGTLR